MAEISELSSDPELRPIQLQSAQLDLELREVELKQKNWDYAHPAGSFRSSIRSPLIIGALLTTLATGGASFVSYINARFQLNADNANKTAQLDLEKQKAQSAEGLEEAKLEASLITNAIQHGGGDPDKVAENLQFLLDSGLIPRTHTRTKLEAYLRQRIPGRGASGAIPPPR